jgi:hypothetical protein
MVTDNVLATAHLHMAGAWLIKIVKEIIKKIILLNAWEIVQASKEFVLVNVKEMVHVLAIVVLYMVDVWRNVINRINFR